MSSVCEVSGNSSVLVPACSVVVLIHSGCMRYFSVENCVSGAAVAFRFRFFKKSLGG